jgi:hypothetical protein
MKIAPTTRACHLAFLFACVTLFIQVLVYRIISLKLLNSYAFLTISLTLLGFACSSIILSRWLDLVLDHMNDFLSLCANGFVLSMLVAMAIFYRVEGPYRLRSHVEFIILFLRWMPSALLFTLPFAFCGLALGGLLSATQFSARQVYFYDLLGSAVGAFCVIPAISAIGVECYSRLRRDVRGGVVAGSALTAASTLYRWIGCAIVTHCGRTAPFYF